MVAKEFILLGYKANSVKNLKKKPFSRKSSGLFFKGRYLPSKSRDPFTLQFVVVYQKKKFLG